MQAKLLEQRSHNVRLINKVHWHTARLVHMRGESVTGHTQTSHKGCGTSSTSPEDDVVEQLLPTPLRQQHG